MKAVFISFNQAFYESILSIMDRSNIRGFSHWDTTFGRGSNTGEPHYGSHAWPALNASILTIVDDGKVADFLAKLKALDKETEAQGLRAFVWNIEQTI